MKGTLETNKAETPVTYDKIFTPSSYGIVVFGVDIKLSTWISVHTMMFSTCHLFYLMVQEKKKKKKRKGCVGASHLVHSNRRRSKACQGRKHRVKLFHRNKPTGNGERIVREQTIFLQGIVTKVH